MDAKDLRTEPALGDRSNDGNTKYSQGDAVLQCNRNKPYQDMGSNSLAKVDIQTARPCAVIGPDRVVPPPASADVYFKKGPVEPWPGADMYRRQPEYPHKLSDYHHPTRNISPRQTFQENMQRIMVPPSYNSAKLKEDHNFPVDPNVAARNNKLNMPTDPKYCDVPYALNPNDQKNIRHTDISVANMNPALSRSVPHGWLPGNAVRPSKPYGVPEMYQYPEYSSCAGPRPMLVPRPHRTINDDTGPTYSDTYYHETNLRYKPYPTVKERLPQARYEYLNNYSNTFHPSPPFPTHKYNLQKSIPQHLYPGYSQVPVKYLDSRMAESVMNGYQRPLNQPANFNAVQYRNQVVHTSYGPVPSNCLQTNKLYSYPADNSVKPMTSNKLPYDNSNKMYAEYENTPIKTYTLPENFYMKGQVLPPNYPSVNMQHAMPPHHYYRKDNSIMRNYEYSPNFRNIDPMNMSRFPSQFSPNATAISPSDSNTSNDTAQTQGMSQEDCGYVSQSSSASMRSVDSNRIPNDFYRRYDYRYGPTVRHAPIMMCKSDIHPINNMDSRNKKNIDVRQFLQMWNEGEDENAENSNKDLSAKAISNVNDMKHYETSNQDQLYVLGLVNVPSEELGKYEHIQKVSKLPENIKGYNGIELLNQFEEVIESSNLNNFNMKPPTTRDFHVSTKGLSSLHAISMPSRPLSPLDVESKISQSVIHKEVGCNFEIKPCSPKMLNVEVATPAQTMLGERAIEKVTNPLNSPILHDLNEEMSNCNVMKHQELRTASNNNSDNAKAPSCKMINTEYSDSVKSNYSMQDLESSSGICLASLPRLDNDIELNFPEVNQQFINANKAESVITSTSKDLPALDVDPYNLMENQNTPEVKTDQSSSNIEKEREMPKLSKYRKLKRKVEREDKNLEQSAQAMRINSVIIKNPENIKSYEDGLDSISPQTKKITQDIQQVPINLTVHTEERANTMQIGSHIDETFTDKSSIETVVDFSTHSNEHSGFKISSTKADVATHTALTVDDVRKDKYLDMSSPKNLENVINDPEKSESRPNMPNILEDICKGSNEENAMIGANKRVGGANECSEVTNREDSKVCESLHSIQLNKSDLELRNHNDELEKQMLYIHGYSVDDSDKTALIREPGFTNNSGYDTSITEKGVTTQKGQDNLFAEVAITNTKLTSNSKKDKLFKRICKQHNSEITEENTYMNNESETISRTEINAQITEVKLNLIDDIVDTETSNDASLYCSAQHMPEKEVIEGNCRTIESFQYLECGPLENIERNCDKLDISALNIKNCLKKELFSPWMQKLLLNNEGLCTSQLSKINNDLEILETENQARSDVITPLDDEMTSNNKITECLSNIDEITIANECNDSTSVETVGLLGETTVNVTNEPMLECVVNYSDADAVGDPITTPNRQIADNVDDDGCIDTGSEFISEQVKNDLDENQSISEIIISPGLEKTTLVDTTSGPNLETVNTHFDPHDSIDNKEIDESSPGELKSDVRVDKIDVQVPPVSKTVLLNSNIYEDKTAHIVTKTLSLETPQTPSYTEDTMIDIAKMKVDTIFNDTDLRDPIKSKANFSYTFGDDDVVEDNASTKPPLQISDIHTDIEVASNITETKAVTHIKETNDCDQNKVIDPILSNTVSETTNSCFGDNFAEYSAEPNILCRKYDVVESLENVVKPPEMNKDKINDSLRNPTSEVTEDISCIVNTVVDHKQSKLISEISEGHPNVDDTSDDDSSSDVSSESSTDTDSCSEDSPMNNSAGQTMSEMHELFNNPVSEVLENDSASEGTESDPIVNDTIFNKNIPGFDSVHHDSSGAAVIDNVSDNPISIESHNSCGDDMVNNRPISPMSDNADNNKDISTDNIILTAKSISEQKDISGNISDTCAVTVKVDENNGTNKRISKIPETNRKFDICKSSVPINKAIHGHILSTETDIFLDDSDSTISTPASKSIEINNCVEIDIDNDTSNNVSKIKDAESFPGGAFGDDDVHNKITGHTVTYVSKTMTDNKIHNTTTNVIQITEPGNYRKDIYDITTCESDLECPATMACANNTLNTNNSIKEQTFVNTDTGVCVNNDVITVNNTNEALFEVLKEDIDCNTFAGRDNVEDSNFKVIECKNSQSNLNNTIITGQDTCIDSVVVDSETNFSAGNVNESQKKSDNIEPLLDSNCDRISQFETHSPKISDPNHNTEQKTNESRRSEIIGIVKLKNYSNSLENSTICPSSQEQSFKPQSEIFEDGIEQQEESENTRITVSPSSQEQTFEPQNEIFEDGIEQQEEIDTFDASSHNKPQFFDPYRYKRYNNNYTSSKKRMSLKRSLSDSALDMCDIDYHYKHDDSETMPLLWPNKRKKLTENIMAPQFITEEYCSMINHSRRNSISSVYNEENISFCILIDDNCIITEEGDDTEKICFTEIPEDCVSCMPTESTNENEITDTAPEMTSLQEEEIEEINCEYSNSYALDSAEDEMVGASWVEDVACVETVVSDDIAEDVIVSASSSPKDTDVSDDESNNNEQDIYEVAHHTDKVRYIYGDKMCSNDAQLVETLYRTPQMDVNKTLIYKEPTLMDHYNGYDAESLEEVLSESNTYKVDETFDEPSSPLNAVSFESKDNFDVDIVNGHSPFDSNSTNLDISQAGYEINEERDMPCQIYLKTQDDTIHSCESSVDNVFSDNQREDNGTVTNSSSPEVSSTTSEDRNSGIMLKITNYGGSRVAQVNNNNSDTKRNTVSCKYTENNDYVNCDTNLPVRPLLTKAAQKYIPPLKESIRDLKIKLPLPEPSLIKLKQLKSSKDEPKLNRNKNRQNIPKKETAKKSKPKFEDVLKSIDEVQFKMHKEKNRKIKKSIPKVVIKKNGNGSHYASTSGKNKYNPDLTGRKWQPWVFIEKNPLVDKMVIKNKMRAIFNHRKNTYVLAETFKKYKSISNAAQHNQSFVISQPKSNEPRGQLKYTIRLKHSY